MNYFRTLKLRTKLFTGFFLLTAITLTVGVVGITKLHAISAADTVLYEQVAVPLDDIGEIATSFQRTRLNLLEYAIATDPGERSRRRENVNKLSQGVAERIERFEKTLLTPEGKRMFQDFRSVREEYLSLAQKAFGLVDAGKTEAAEALLAREGRDVAHRYQEILDKLSDAKQEYGRQANKNNTDMAANSTMLMYLLLGLGFAASLGLGIFITSSVMGQLGEDPGYLQEVSSEIAQGNLDVSFRAQKRPGGVYEVMQAMVATMREKIAQADQKTAEAAEEARHAQLATAEANEAKARAERAKAEGMIQAAEQLQRSVEVISSASEELSAQVEQSSRGAEVQSDRVGETATAMEEMNATVLEVARNAAQAADSSAQARSKATQGASIVSQAVESIGQVQNTSLALREDMRSLGRQAEDIGQIMNVISDIADQTNLLALNAAIEAARAGDAGRGFAVVADEVRKLAEKTMTATKQVGESIRGIQEGTSRNLEHVQRSVTAVDEATRLANESGVALREIVQLVEVSTDQVRSIATASEEQSAASEEINRSIEEVNRISRETSGAMTQSAQAVGELASQAQSLRTLIEHMKSGG